MIDDHIISLQMPQLVISIKYYINYYNLIYRIPKECVVPLSSVKDHCIFMDLTEKTNHVFVSLFPNSSEPE